MVNSNISQTAPIAKAKQNANIARVIGSAFIFCFLSKIYNIVNPINPKTIAELI